MACNFSWENKKMKRMESLFIHTLTSRHTHSKNNIDMANMEKEDWYSKLSTMFSSRYSTQTQTQSSCPSACMHVNTQCCYFLSFDLRSLIQECFQRGCHPGYETYSRFRAAQLNALSLSFTGFLLPCSQCHKCESLCLCLCVPMTSLWKPHPNKRSTHSINKLFVWRVCQCECVYVPCTECVCTTTITTIWIKSEMMLTESGCYMSRMSFIRCV